eukprot:GFYU01044321.1.p2 GENE.GFYU01044321.1~~GFYU01044321.1.p2  ORF type:complete len:183 (-),score=2.25 GFYU01044321.1:64-612(-)
MYIVGEGGARIIILIIGGDNSCSNVGADVSIFHCITTRALWRRWGYYYGESSVHVAVVCKRSLIVGSSSGSGVIHLINRIYTRSDSSSVVVIVSCFGCSTFVFIDIWLGSGISRIRLGCVQLGGSGLLGGGIHRSGDSSSFRNTRIWLSDVCISTSSNSSLGLCRNSSSPLNRRIIALLPFA